MGDYSLGTEETHFDWIGKSSTPQTFRQAHTARIFDDIASDYIQTGLTLGYSGGNLTISTGEGWCEGWRIKILVARSITVSESDNTYNVYLKYTTSGSGDLKTVSNVQCSLSTLTPPQSDMICLGQCTVVSNQVTGTSTTNREKETPFEVLDSSGALIDNSVTDAKRDYNTTKTRYWCVSIGAKESGEGFGASDYGTTSASTGTTVDVGLPVTLPHGATVTELRGTFQLGTSSSGTIILRRRYYNTWAAGEAMATASTAGSGVKTATDTSISNPVIDNDNYVYFLDVDLTSTSGTCALMQGRIKYTITEPYP